jgi:predicted Rossmann fold flavoprotein
MAAIAAAREGASVILFEKNSFAGRKILATGNGRCNLTNRNVIAGRYHGAVTGFISSILKKFDQSGTIQFFESSGVALKEEDNGRIFPRSNQASTIVDALNYAINDSGVTMMAGVKVLSIEKSEDFAIKTEDGRLFNSGKLIMATGGKAAFQFGSSGDGFSWAFKLGHHIIPVFASLVPVETVEAWTREVQGVRIEAGITLKAGDRIIGESYGDCLFTNYGLSGTAVMALAGKIAPLLHDNTITIFIDLYPEMKACDLDKKISNIFDNGGSRTAAASLAGLFNSRLADAIISLSGISHDKSALKTSAAERQKIVQCIKEAVLTVKKVRPLKEAQASSGGIDTREIDKDTLESKLVRGLYFAGEIMDVDGDSGGFNLQWAWSSGVVSGKSAAGSKH